MKNLTSLTLAIILFVVLFIFVYAAKTQGEILDAKILFITASIVGYLVLTRDKKSLQPIPVKVKAHRKY